jgi:hypothetical protein
MVSRPGSGSLRTLHSPSRLRKKNTVVKVLFRRVLANVAAARVWAAVIGHRFEFR